jgi:hypothetical protein
LKIEEAIIDNIYEAGVSPEGFGDLPRKMAGQLSDSRSDNTNVKYLSYFKKWENFIKEKGGNSVPASPIHIALYLTDLLDKMNSASVISATVYSIKWAHGLKGLPDPTDNLFVKNLLESAKRTHVKVVNKKEPLNAEVLISICNEFENSRDILIIRD